MLCLQGGTCGTSDGHANGDDSSIEEPPVIGLYRVSHPAVEHVVMVMKSFNIIIMV